LLKTYYYRLRNQDGQPLYNETNYVTNPLTASTSTIIRITDKNLNPIAPADAGVYGKVVIDDYFPRTIVENQDKWSHLIVKNATEQIRDWLPKHETF
jgi:hypothetical protein